MHIYLNKSIKTVNLSHEALGDEIVLKSYTFVSDNNVPSPEIYVNIPWLQGKEHVTNLENHHMLVLPVPQTGGTFKAVHLDYTIPISSVTSIPKSFPVEVYENFSGVFLPLTTTNGGDFELHLFFEITSRRLQF